MELRLPATLSHLRIKHFKALKDERFNSLDKPELMTLEQKILFVALFADVTENEVKEFTIKQVNKMFYHILKTFDGFTPSLNPPMELTINGKLYERINPEKVGSGWHIDFSKTDINKDPVQLACLFYFPKGQKYAALDENKNVINPIRERYDDFKNNFPLTVFLECTAFFLVNWQQSTRLYTVKQKAKLKTESWLVNSLGKNVFTEWLLSTR